MTASNIKCILQNAEVILFLRHFIGKVKEEKNNLWRWFHISFYYSQITLKHNAQTLY